MIKFILTIVSLVVLYYAYTAYINRDEFISYDNSGKKIIRTECPTDDEFKCHYRVGKICENGGYKELSKVKTDDTVVLLAECGEKSECLIEKLF